jgi:hypothetical protein
VTDSSLLAGLETTKLRLQRFQRPRDLDGVAGRDRGTNLVDCRLGVGDLDGVRRPLVAVAVGLDGKRRAHERDQCGGRGHGGPAEWSPETLAPDLSLQGSDAFGGRPV